MSDELQRLESMVSAYLAHENSPTQEKIRELITTLRIPMFQSISETDAEMLARRFEERLVITMVTSSVITDKKHRPWLEAAKKDYEPYYWERYRKLLTEKGRANGSEGVLARLDEDTDKICGLMENPEKDGPWDRRGMVVGHVQSGKTENYIGAICKAADAGYKLIVVIAGIHNNLRNQTQRRIEEGFVGKDSAHLFSSKDSLFIGVAKYSRNRIPFTFTSSRKDFNKNTASAVGFPLQNLPEPAIFVIKKNSSTLKNLLEWLREHNAKRGGNKVDSPMLLIDDEADNASINIKYGKGEVARINGQIRELLNLFERSCYIGYTATPFANIFIDPDTDDEMLLQDLFPRHFIISLNAPSNYFGANRVFIDDSVNIIRYISDNEDVLPLKHLISTRIVALPPSLITATRTFILARAIRLARGHKNPHCSMLVNASRFTGVQGQIRNEIHECLKSIQASIRLNGALPLDKAMKDKEIFALRDVWQSEFASTEVSWQEVQRFLHEAVSPIKVEEVNSKSSGKINYEDYEKDGLNVIAVGGYSLSRGLTLEGLMVSYFLRNSMMYDTLMQMGRWFGYRDGYDDLCRVWMPEQAEGWYAHITESIEELRDEIRRMEASGGTPEDFGLKVRSHPDTLIVTARNKMGSGENFTVRIGLANKFVETHRLRRDEGSLQANRLATQNLIKRFADANRPISDAVSVQGAGWLLRDVPVLPILDFISEFQNEKNSHFTESDLIRPYIEERVDNYELAHWDVLLTSIERTNETTQVDFSLGVKINCESREAGKSSDHNVLLISNKQRVSSRGVEATGLTADEIEIARKAYREDPETHQTPTGEWNYPDKIYRSVRKRPLLIIHLLKVSGMPAPVVAWSISFPNTKLEEKKVAYVVTTTYLRETYGYDLEEDEMGGDND